MSLEIYYTDTKVQKTKKHTNCLTVFLLY